MRVLWVKRSARASASLCSESFGSFAFLLLKMLVGYARWLWRGNYRGGGRGGGFGGSTKGGGPMFAARVNIEILGDGGDAGAIGG